MFPATFRAFAKQRIRWSRNSYRCYLTAISRGWLWKQPLVTQITVLQILLTPLSMFGAIAYFGLTLRDGNWPLVGVSLGWMLAGRALRGSSHLREHPRDLLYLPAVALTVILVALPIKFYALLTMNTHGWLTRAADRLGGEGQTEATLSAEAQAVPVAADGLAWHEPALALEGMMDAAD